MKKSHHCIIKFNTNITNTTNTLYSYSDIISVQAYLDIFRLPELCKQIY